MLVDTVGFVAKLPHELVEAFKGTLEQVIDADLILHVVDASHPAWQRRVETVNGVLDELGASRAAARSSSQQVGSRRRRKCRSPATSGVGAHR